MTEIRPIAGDDELAAALDLRERVFCGEQGVSLEGDRDGRDGEALQLVALDDGTVVATCRVLLDGDVARFQRLCVAPEARRRGLAAALLAAAEGAARAAQRRPHRTCTRRPPRSRSTSARATPSYGAPFDDEGIEHLAMEKRLV